TNDAATVDLLAAAQRAGDLPQRLLVLGTDLPAGDDPDADADADAGGGDRPGSSGSGRRLVTGARKIALAERDPPPLEALVDEVRRAGRAGVAVHCVTRQDLVLAATALSAAGGGPHRIEHASVAPPELVALVAAVPACVVTQPGFVRQHGDRYRREVDPADLPWLYRLAAWRRAGVPLAAGSDAPFGDADPWEAMAAATDRRTAGGALLGPGEALTPEEALGLFLAPLSSPGGPPRVVRPGAPADLCLLAEPWAAARRALGEVTVAATVADGRPVFLEAQAVPARLSADGTNASGGSGRPNR
ncbi:MAG: amidohydrolase family protein, partial [Acidimicrobiales bacterium]